MTQQQVILTTFPWVKFHVHKQPQDEKTYDMWKYFK